MLNTVNFHRFTYKQVEESAPMHRMHEDFLLSKALSGITKMMEFLLDLYFPSLYTSFPTSTLSLNACLSVKHASTVTDSNTDAPNSRILFTTFFMNTSYFFH